MARNTVGLFIFDAMNRKPMYYIMHRRQQQKGGKKKNRKTVFFFYSDQLSWVSTDPFEKRQRTRPPHLYVFVYSLFRIIEFSNMASPEQGDLANLCVWRYRFRSSVAFTQRFERQMHKFSRCWQHLLRCICKWVYLYAKRQQDHQKKEEDGRCWHRPGDTAAGESRSGLMGKTPLTEQ